MTKSTDDSGKQTVELPAVTPDEMPAADARETPTADVDTGGLGDAEADVRMAAPDDDP